MSDKVEKFFERARIDLGAAIVGSVLTDAFYLAASIPSDGKAVTATIVAAVCAVITDLRITRPHLDKKYG